MRTRVLLGVSLLALLATGCSDSDAPLPALEAPAIESVVAGDGTAVVTWDFVAGADAYNVYWSEGDVFVPDEAQAALDVTDLEFMIAGLENGAVYTICVTVTKGTREGPPSEEMSVTLPPGAPDVVAATSTDTAVIVEWTPVAGATSYDVYRDTSPDVSLTTSVRLEDVSSPLVDAVPGGAMHYYVVVAVGTGGTGKPSSVVAGEVLVVVGAPTNLTVAVPEEAPNTLLVSWSPPVEGEVDSYNLYFATHPDVTTADEVIEGAVSPYTHTGLLGRTTYYYRVAAVLSGVVGPLSAEASGTPRGSPGGGGGGGGGHEEGLGNNLALPLVFADGYGLGGAAITGTDWQDYATGLRPLSTENVTALPVLDAATALEINGVLLYPQQSPSTWQAEWRNGSDAVQDVTVDWGDNLRSANITARSVVRMEAVFYQDVPDDPMMAVAMAPMGGTGTDEMWGTPDGEAAVESSRRNLFAVTARLTLTKLLGEGGAPDPAVEPISLAVADSLGEIEPHAAPAEGGGGAPMKFGLEINVAGKAVYGYVWMLRKSSIPELARVGWWRATVSLDPTAEVGGATVHNNTRFVGVDPSDPAAVLDSETSCSIDSYVE